MLIYFIVPDKGDGDCAHALPIHWFAADGAFRAEQAARRWISLPATVRDCAAFQHFHLMLIDIDGLRVAGKPDHVVTITNPAYWRSP